MTLHTINSSLSTYAGKISTNPQNVINKLDGFSDAESNLLPPPPPASENNSSLVQSVLQSLQNLGLNALDNVETSTALQPFMQNLYTSLSGGANPPPPPPISLPQVVNVSESSDGSIVESTAPTITTISGGTNLKYNIDLSAADLGDYLPQVAANIQTALENIGKYISSKTTFDVKVFTRNADPNTLAEASTTMITANSNGKETIDSSFVSDSMYGVELSPNTPDSNLYINIDRLSEMSFSGKPAPDKFDLTSILTHEILHGIAFTGLLGSASDLKTGYDELISTANDSPVFIGRHAQTVNNGRPVPLSPETSGVGSAFYHIAVPSDLMSESIKKGEVKTISALDVAMLEDMGVTVTGVSPNSQPPKVQMAYAPTALTPSDAVKNLMNSMQQQGELQTSFDNLVSALGGSEGLPDVNLQNFLTQLSVNTQQLPPIENTGSLFSVSA